MLFRAPSRGICSAMPVAYTMNTMADQNLTRHTPYYPASTYIRTRLKTDHDRLSSSIAPDLPTQLVTVYTSWIVLDQQLT